MFEIIYPCLFVVNPRIEFFFFPEVANMFLIVSLFSSVVNPYLQIWQKSFEPC